METRFQRVKVLLIGATISTISSSLILMVLWSLVSCDSSSPQTELETGFMNGGMSAGEPLDGSGGVSAGEMTSKPEGESAGTSAEESAGASAGASAGVSAGASAGEAAGTAAGMIAGEAAGTAAGMIAGESAGIVAGEFAGGAAGEAAGEAAGSVSGEVTGGMVGAPNSLRLNGVWSTCLDEGLRSERHQYQFISNDEESLVGTWRFQEDRFGDGGCIGTPSTTLVEEGTFRLSIPPEDAWPIDLSISTRTITPSSESAATVLRNVCSQDFTARVPTDLSDEGCARLGYLPLSDCPVRYDLIALEGETLQLGELIDEVDMCLEAQRPNTLGRSYSP